MRRSLTGLISGAMAAGTHPSGGKLGSIYLLRDVRVKEFLQKDAFVLEVASRTKCEVKKILVDMREASEKIKTNMYEAYL